MSQFSQSEQTNIVKQAKELKTAIIQGERKLANLKREKFKPVPAAPVQKKVNLNITPPEPDYSSLPKITMTFPEYLEDDRKNHPNILNKLLGTHPFKRGFAISAVCFAIGIVLWSVAASAASLDLLGIAQIPNTIGSVGFALTLGYYFVKRAHYPKRVKELENELSQQPQYQQMKAAAEKAAKEKHESNLESLRKQQAEFDKQYASEKNQYDTVVLPTYQKEKDEWTARHEEQIQIVSDMLNKDKKAQSDLYGATKIIPVQYQDINALTYLYEMMSTSDYDIKEAVNMYDKEIQRQQDLRRLQEQQRANDLAEEQNYRLSQQNALLDEQNYQLDQQSKLQEEQNAIAEKARKQARNAAFVSTVQRHNTNKYLKGKR